MFSYLFCSMSKHATYHQHLHSSLKMPHDIHYPVLFSILVIYGIFVYDLFILYPFYHYIKTTCLSKIYFLYFFCLLSLIETPRWEYSELSSFKFISFISCLRTSSFTESFALWVIEKYTLSVVLRVLLIKYHHHYLSRCFDDNQPKF